MSLKIRGKELKDCEKWELIECIEAFQDLDRTIDNYQAKDLKQENKELRTENKMLRKTLGVWNEEEKG